MNDDNEEPTPEDIAALEAILARQDQRCSAPYDGLMGTSPSWVPGRVQDQFQRIRNNLLNWRNNAEPTPTPPQLVRWIDQSISQSQMPTGVYSCCEYVPLELMQGIPELAAIKYAVGLGENEGLIYLTDAIHAAAVVMGNKHRKAQQKKASASRGKVSATTQLGPRTSAM